MLGIKGLIIIRSVCMALASERSQEGTVLGQDVRRKDCNPCGCALVLLSISSDGLKALGGTAKIPDPVSCTLQEAVDKKVLGEPNQMAIASPDTIGIPSVPMTLLKGYDKQSFSFETDNKMPNFDKKSSNYVVVRCRKPLTRRSTKSQIKWPSPQRMSTAFPPCAWSC